MDINEILGFFEKKNLVIFDDQRYSFNLNIVGRRRPQSRLNYFDDELLLFWKWENRWILRRWPITTFPGLPSLLKPEYPGGTAILVPGQYRGCYELGKHRGLYPALVQMRPVSVFRDDTLDDIIDQEPHTIQTGYFGINIHKASLFTRVVGPNSAGCQVFQKSTDFEQFIQLCERAAVYWGNRFTYTLIET